jgi:hypothetical protein
MQQFDSHVSSAEQCAFLGYFFEVSVYRIMRYDGVRVAAARPLKAFL